MLRTDVAEKARPLLVKMAKQSGIIADNLSDVQTLDVLRDMLIEIRPLSIGVVQREQVKPDYATGTEAASPLYPRTMNGTQLERVEAVRSALERSRVVVLTDAAANRYRALALTAIEEACMWAVKAISHENG